MSVMGSRVLAGAGRFVMYVSVAVSMTLTLPPSQLARYTRELSPPAAMVKRNLVSPQIGGEKGPKEGKPGMAVAVLMVLLEVLIAVT